MVLSACHNEQGDIQVTWNNKQAKAVRIPAKLVPDASKDSIRQFLQVRVTGASAATPVIGSYQIEKDIVFEPLLPFSQGMMYEVFYKTKKLGSFHIPLADVNDPPQLTAFYPGADTLPENLLKIYLQFSRPMQEGRSANFITLVRNETDTLHDVFLDLQPELWNENRTVLTVWLDPGRIKRDLQPNLRMGIPLHEKQHYRLVISGKWKDAQGIALAKEYSHSFITGNRDSLGPDPSKWIIHASQQVIVIDPGESLDHFLLAECLHITDAKGLAVAGHVALTGKDEHYHFTPDKPLAPGTYTLSIETKLEDLAGNNINRPFDRDFTHSKQPSTNPIYTRAFTVAQ